jgi:glycosyltransferase involved in cell wall biosynthesis
MRFVASGALDLPADRFDLHFAATESCRDELAEELARRGIDPTTHLFPLQIPESRHLLWKRLFDCSCVRYRRVSPSFSLRAESFKRMGRAPYVLLRMLSAPGIYELRRAFYFLFHRPLPSLLKVLDEVKPDRVVVPSALLDNITDEILLAAKKRSIPSLLLSSNWDNLSSKGLLTFRPDHLACWGEQTKLHAQAIQRMPSERVSPLGAPHFDRLLRHRDTSRNTLRTRLDLPLEKKVVLFAGSFREIDETAMLLSLERAIEDGRIPGTVVLYRPHPWRMNREEAHFGSMSWKHVRMDPVMAQAYETVRKTGTASDSGIDLDHLGCLYGAADALISPMSTALLEALHFGVPVLALNFGDGRHYWGPDKAGAMLHFREFYHLPEVAVLERSSDLVAATRKLLKLGERRSESKIACDLDFFVKTAPGNYASRLADLLGRL